MNTAPNDPQNNPWGLLWPHRRAAFAGALIGIAFGLLLYLVLPARWEGRMITSPAGRGAGADLSAFLPASESPTIQYLLQRVGSVTAAEFSIYETLLTSPRIAAALQKDEAFKGAPLEKLCRGCATEPAVLAKWLDRNIRIRPLGATQMRRITLRLSDRTMATDLLRALHRLADETIRTDARLRTEQRITYLRAQLGMVSNPDHRDALVALLKEQERTRMMVGIDHDFAAEAIDPASLSPRPVFPRLSIFLPVFGLIGMILGFLYGFVRR